MKIFLLIINDMIFKMMKLAMQVIAEMATANVKIPVVRLVHRPTAVPITIASTFKRINIILTISRMIMIASSPDPKPLRSGGLNSICAEMQMAR